MSIIYALIAAFGYASNNIMINQAPKALQSNLIFYRSLAVFLMNVPLLFILKYFLPSVFPYYWDFKLMLLGALLSVIIFVGLVNMIKGLVKGPVSIIGPLIGSTGILSSVVSYFAFGEPMSLMKVVSILLGIFSLFVISFDFKNAKSIFEKDNGVVNGLICFVILGVFLSFLKPFVIGLGPIMFSTVVEFTNTLCAFVYFGFITKTLFKTTHSNFDLAGPLPVIKKNIKWIFALSIGILIAAISQNLALTGANINLVEPVLRTSITLFTLIISITYLKENPSKQQKIGLVGLSVSLVMIGIS